MWLIGAIQFKDTMSTESMTPSRTVLLLLATWYGRNPRKIYGASAMFLIGPWYPGLLLYANNKFHCEE
jgi:hypothetical protein